MKYEDFLTPTEQEYRIMRQGYMQEVERETGDLQEILQKMETQKEYLQRNNNDQKYNKIIDKLADNISELNSLIISNQSHFLRKYSQLFANDPATPQGEAISPIRHINENISIQPNTPIETPSINVPNNNLPPLSGDINIPIPNVPNLPNIPNFQSPSTTPNTDNNLSTETPNIPNSDSSNNNGNAISPEKDNQIAPTTPNENIDSTDQNSNAIPPKTNTMKRNCPKQSHFLFDAFRQVNVNLSKILGNFPHKKMRTTTHSPHLNKNRWHIAPPTEDNYILQSTTKESTILSEECQPKNVILHNQIDIIRLFLLYLMLKPNCKYLSSITTIANSQFDILLELM